MRKKLSYLQNKTVHDGSMLEHAPDVPQRYRNLFFFARFNDALANPYGPSNPDSAIKTQFIVG
jgi:hypothetical protein